MRPFPLINPCFISIKIQSIFMEIAKRFIRLQKDFTIYLLAAASR